ncbi:MAG: HlyD family efflux transporter periplasmic adaptor subunit [Cyanobacteria bacterium P01_D01_bin.105]
MERARLAGLISAGLFCAACVSCGQREADLGAAQAGNVAAVAQTTRIIALGQLKPQGEIIQLSVPNAEDSRVNQLLVTEGDFVVAGQVIAVLQGFERRERDLQAAEKTVELHQAKLNQLLAGEGKLSEVAAKEAAIAELQAQRRNQTLENEAAIASAQAELTRAQITQERNISLVREGALSQDQLDQSSESLAMAQAELVSRQAQLNNGLQTLSEQIEQERSLLANLSEVRPTDVAVAQVELEQAEIAVAQRQADLEETQVRVPVGGQILRINTRVGERVDTDEGIIELGNTQQMMAIAEIYETDVTRVAAGQAATVTSEYGGFEGSLRATVDHVGLQIGARGLSDGSTNPTTDENQRVVEVRLQIHPDDSDKVATLTNMQVRVEIQTDANGESP